ncbi:MAG: peptide chain release factor 3 [Magnetococcales bacterium]|nr:peptide chain release factor 3 [Magnetococcales bacterium]MBF0116067.1 peptide chain release factor 3 [Magnetococcales bacterium]
MNEDQHPVPSRRTFAIISHPDAGKTTLTEKLLLFGGAIQMAGRVKARGQQRLARSDWMKVEQERGISVTVSVMTYTYQGLTFNLLDTPGHADFSEDTYRTLTAVDSAIMVIDAAKGIEAQTLKLFEVCRLRNVPIITFINKMDRDGRDPFDLMSEIEEKLALEAVPATWPIGSGRDFLGCYDLRHEQLLFMDRSDGREVLEAETCSGLEDDKIDQLIPPGAAERLREEVDMVRGLCPTFNLNSYRQGHMTPVFFGSAINNFGVRELLQGVSELAPSPRPQRATERLVDPLEEKVTAFVFKIQANMDPNHRDRVAFVRLCSGHFTRGMKMRHVRSGKTLTLHNPMMFLAQDRGLADEAWAGDILGIPNHGVLRIGDTLTEGEDLHFLGIPNFAPEMLRRVRADDPLRLKHLGRTLVQLGEEGAARVFKTELGSDWIIGVVGGLQFDVIADRIRTEYNIPVHLEGTSIHTARWLEADDSKLLKRFMDANIGEMAQDHDGCPVFLARNAWRLDNAIKEWPGVRFLKVKE